MSENTANSPNTAGANPPGTTRTAHSFRPDSKLWVVVGIAVGILLIFWLNSTPAGLLGKADAVGYAVCHRINTRSFHLGERPISLCARCTGQYLGAVIGLVFLHITAPRRGGRPPWRVITVLGGLFLIWGFDGANSFANLIPEAPHLYTPNNTLRLLTGLGMGLGMSTAIYLAFNQTMWQDWRPLPVLPGLRQTASLLLLTAVLAALVLTENPLLLYPLALLSAAGVMVLLTMIYAVVIMILLRRENQASSYRELWLPLLAGFGLALVQIAILDLIRFTATGTWEGFHVFLG